MSGAQGKAAEIAKAVAIVAEVDRSRIETRHSQGWISQVTDSAEEAVKLAQAALEAGESTSIAYHGNIVDLLEYVNEHQVHVHLLSDQTSCHNVYDGGYCPALKSVHVCWQKTKKPSAVWLMKPWLVTLQ